ncbi:MAG: hypothetical protein HUU46_10465 [Candidatus Hydrogenedentes bacterium]|nr:hypothetical protein [Candidatus Hydrogenedentota bacterium]
MLTGILMFVSGLSAAVFVTGEDAENYFPLGMRALGVLAPMIYIFAAFKFMFRTDRVLQFLFKPQEDAESQTQPVLWTSHLELGIKLLGLYFLVRDVPDVFEGLVTMLKTHDLLMGNWYVLSSSVRCALAIFMIVKSSLVVSWLSKDSPITKPE